MFPVPTTEERNEAAQFTRLVRAIRPHVSPAEAELTPAQQLRLVADRLDPPSPAPLAPGYYWARGRPRPNSTGGPWLVVFVNTHGEVLAPGSEFEESPSYWEFGPAVTRPPLPV